MNKLIKFIWISRAKFLWFLTRIFFANLLALAPAAMAAECLSSEAIDDVMNEFQMRMQPLLASSPRTIEFRHNTFAMLAEEPIMASVEFEKDGPAILRITGGACPADFGPDELRFLMCHELGHIMGGPPYMNFVGHDGLQSSAEGQADYFATSSCLPSLFAQDDNERITSISGTYPTLRDICQYGETPNSQSMCIRILSAGFRFAEYVRQIPSSRPGQHGYSPPTAVIIESAASDTAVHTLLRDYPTPQCRFDTMVAGIKCQARSRYLNFTDDTSAVLGCGETVAIASRPACWYNASEF